jgi:elongator complex protein 1
MDSVKMKSKIHIDLKQFDKAVKKLSQGGEPYFEEALTIIKKQRLFKQALEFYKD